MRLISGFRSSAYDDQVIEPSFNCRVSQKGGALSVPVVVVVVACVCVCLWLGCLVKRDA